MTTPIRLAVLAAVFATAASGEAQEKKPDDKKAERVENPEYKWWSSFKAGTSVVMTTTLGTGTLFPMTVTTKLVEVKDDKVVVQMKEPATKRDIPKHLDNPMPGFDPKSGEPDGTTEVGKEKVKIGGTEYQCKWFKFKQKQKTATGEEELEGQVWMSDEVPGGMVKMTMKTKAGGMTMEATEITIKK